MCEEVTSISCYVAESYALHASIFCWYEIYQCKPAGKNFIITGIY